MKKIKFFFYFFIIQVYPSYIINNPIHLNDEKYPFVLPYSNDNYYYVITSGESLKIDKENGNIIKRENIKKIKEYSDKAVFCTNELNINYIYESKEFYSFDNPSLSITKLTRTKNSDVYEIKYIGCIPQNNDFIIYGYHSNKLYFLSNSKEYSYGEYISSNINEKMSCKPIEDEEFICAFILEEYIKIFFLTYHINKITNYISNYLSSIYDILVDSSNKYKNVAIYNTNISATTKILCKEFQDGIKIICFFISIKKEVSVSFLHSETKYYFDKIGNLEFVFNSENFSEKDCHFIEFNNEYLFCCGIIEYIK